MQGKSLLCMQYYIYVLALLVPNSDAFILFTKSRGYSNIKSYNIYQTNVINLKQLVLISKVI